MRSLPAHPDVREGLRRLKDAGFRTVTLTNSAAAVVEQQLSNAGLTEFFERSFSVDTVRRFKPAPEPYRYVASELKVDASQLRMVAAHAWDVVGAMQADGPPPSSPGPAKSCFHSRRSPTSSNQTCAPSPTALSLSIRLAEGDAGAGLSRRRSPA